MRIGAGVEATLARLVSDLGVSAVIVTHDRAQAQRLARRTVRLSDERLAA